MFSLVLAYNLLFAKIIEIKQLACRSDNPFMNIVCKVGVLRSISEHLSHCVDVYALY